MEKIQNAFNFLLASYKFNLDNERFLDFSIVKEHSTVNRGRLAWMDLDVTNRIIVNLAALLSKCYFYTVIAIPQVEVIIKL